MKIFELEINNWYIQTLAAEMTVSVTDSTFHELQVLIELVFRYNSLLTTFILQESSSTS